MGDRDPFGLGYTLWRLVKNNGASTSTSPADQLAGALQLLNIGANPNCGNPEEGSALYWAVRGGRYDMAALLVKHGADVSRVVPSQGWSPLMAAAWKHDEARYVSLLLDGNLGPEVREEVLRARDAQGRSALYFALQKGHAKAAAALMARGANAVDERRRLPSSWWRDKAMGRCRQLIEEADRVASIFKLRMLADAGVAASIQAITQGREQSPGPTVEYKPARIARPKQPKGRRRGKRGGGMLMPCAGTLVEHVCVALPEELWVELMRYGWGGEHFGR